MRGRENYFLLPIFTHFSLFTFSVSWKLIYLVTVRKLKFIRHLFIQSAITKTSSKLFAVSELEIRVRRIKFGTINPFYLGYICANCSVSRG